MIKELKNLQTHERVTASPSKSDANAIEEMLVEAQGLFDAGYLEQALEELDKLELFSYENTTKIEIKKLLLKGKICRDKGSYEEAEQFFLIAKQLASQSQDYKQLIEALNLEASILSIQGKDTQALKQLGVALDFAQRFDMYEWQAKLHTNIGNLFHDFGDYPKALEHLNKAYDLYHTLPQQVIGEAIALMQLGFLYKDMGNLSKAKTLHIEARVLAAALEDPKIEVASINNIAELSQLKGELEEAKAYYKEAFEFASQVGYKRYVIDNLNGLGQLNCEQENYSSAIDIHQKALKLAKQLADKDAELQSTYALGKVYLKAHIYDLALSHLKAGVVLAESLEQPKPLFELHRLLAECLEAQGDFASANTHLKSFYHFEKQIFNKENEEKTRILSVKFDLERAHHEANEYRKRTELEQNARIKAEKIIDERTRELEEAHLEVVMRLAVAAEYRDDDTGEHTKRVGRTAAAIAYVLGCSLDNVQLIFRAARLHDVGKIGVSDSILLKPGKLTNEEFDLIKTHTTMGARILENGQTKLLNLAESIALSHHERWDGTGYPNKLSGNEIPLSARIVSVADVLDALTHERPYKKAWSIEEALCEIERSRGTQFDSIVVDACLQLFKDETLLSPLDSCDEWSEMLTTLKTIDKLNIVLNQEDLACLRH